MNKEIRTYRRSDPGPFRSAISTLMESEVSLDAAQPPPTQKKKGVK